MKQTKFTPLPLALMVLGLSFNLQASSSFNIMDYGAVKSWEVKSTEAIARAIDAASAAGGGTVVIPAGPFLTGPIHLKSHITLYVEGGAHVKFSTDFDDYLPMVPSRFEGVEVVNFSPLIYAHKATNIAIKGRSPFDRDIGGFMSVNKRRKIHHFHPFKPRWNHGQVIIKIRAEFHMGASFNIQSDMTFQMDGSC